MISTVWQEIRALRASPTGAAATNADRRRVFAASLRQAEELADAAQVAGYAAKPLPLFYSLSQAGRAIAAARLPGSGLLRGHGLSVPVNAQTPILETIIKSANIANVANVVVDSFRGVSQAIGSPLLQGNAQLGELWAANPDLRDVPIPSPHAWPKALRIPLGGLDLNGRVPGQTGPDPENIALTTEGFLSASVDLPGETGSEIEKALEPYTTLRGAFGLKQLVSGSDRAGPNDLVVRVPDSSGIEHALIAVNAPRQTTLADGWRRQQAMVSIVEIDESLPRYPVPSLVGFALPQIAGGPCPLPLMLWWALLLGLSSLARYEPATWTSAIDLDNSELAVSLERVIDVAQERVPLRILESLR